MSNKQVWNKLHQNCFLGTEKVNIGKAVKKASSELSSPKYVPGGVTSINYAEAACFGLPMMQMMRIFN